MDHTSFVKFIFEVSIVRFCLKKARVPLEAYLYCKKENILL